MFLAGLVGPLVLLLVGYVFLKCRSEKKRPPSLRSVAVLVLGDIGRSPRMMYHAESFANNGFQTFVVGYDGSRPNPSLLSIPHVRFLHLSQLPTMLLHLPFVFLAPIKIMYQILTILYTLLFRIPEPPEFIIVQNPPSIPTLALVWLVGRLRPTRIIIDWHNLGYTILALKLGRDHIFVEIAKLLELYFGRSAYAHLFVTKAMKDYLREKWDLQGYKVVLHDRPPSQFHRCSPSEIHEVFSRLQPLLTQTQSLDSFLPSSDPPLSTSFTQTTESAFSSQISAPFGSPGSLVQNIHVPSLRFDRTALLVSSTSWTADEDFSILVDALGLYERMANNENNANSDRGGLPKVLMIVTGKGPLKGMYMNQIQELQKDWGWVRCISLWLDAADYPLLLGSADLGICLHSSSSALDLPMKIVDMFGCGLPVCALDFACLNELVKPGLNGLVFKTAEELAGQLVSLLKSFPHSPMLDSLRSSLIKSASSPSASSSYSFSSSVNSHYLRQQNQGNVDDDETSEIGEAPGPGDRWEWNSWAENWNDIVRPLVLRDAARCHHED